MLFQAGGSIIPLCTSHKAGSLRIRNVAYIRDPEPSISGSWRKRADDSVELPRACERLRQSHLRLGRLYEVAGCV
jgi:hypothetical protein